MTFYSPLSERDLRRVHAAALRVLDETGVRVESEEILGLLGDSGGRVDLAGSRVRFSPTWVERFIEESEKYDWSTHRMRLGTWAGVYASAYLDPETDELRPFTEKTFADYVRMGNALEHIDSVSNLGIPFSVPGMPPAYGALTEKLFGWKYGSRPSGTVQFSGLCPYIEEMYARRAEERSRSLQDVFVAEGFLISPLRLARTECDQLLYFRQRGLRMRIGHLLSMGASAPVTVVGAAVLHLAESLFLGILGRVLWGDRGISVGAGMMVMDMRTTMSMYGRPETPLVAAVIGQAARFYGASSGSQGGLSDAKAPSVQAGAQKAMSAVAGMLSCGGASMDSGLLSVDEVCSPEQLVYDGEMASALRRIADPIDLTDEALAVAEIDGVGPGGAFVGTELTARRFRTDLWEPAIWAAESTKEWLAHGAVSDRAQAKELIKEVLSMPRGEPGLDESCERDLRDVVRRAVAANAAE